jgi:hypothetical protein
MTLAIRKGRAKRKPQPIYGRVRTLVDPETGEEVGALVPSTSSDKQAMRSRRYKTGDVLRMELKKPRTPKFHRLAMALLQLVVENSDMLSVDQALTVLKVKMGCAQPIIDAASGKTFWILESIAFDALGEDAFREWARNACRVVARDYFPGWTPEQVERAAELMVQE